MTRHPVTSSGGEAAYLITNAQVTGAPAPGRTMRRRRRMLLRQIRSQAADGLVELVSPLRARKNLSGDCARPIQQTELGGTGNRPILDTFLRCRKCDECLRHRSRVWAARAKAEIEAHPRTWMVTLTCTPEVHYRLLLQAERAARLRGVNPSDWVASEEFVERWGQLGKEVTKWLKRVRITGARFVYLQVVEAHKSGLPHVHLLVHDEGDTTYRRLVEAWKLGFSHAKLVEGPAAARYVSKYLAKSALARVRASRGYGAGQINALDAEGQTARVKF